MRSAQRVAQETECQLRLLPSQSVRLEIAELGLSKR